MKTLFSNQEQTKRVKIETVHTHQFLISFVFCLLSFVLTSSTDIPQKNQAVSEDSRKSKLAILEKLENGKQVSSEEISSSFGDFNPNDPGSVDFDLPDLAPIPELPQMNKKQSFPGPFYYHDYNGKEHIIISDYEIKEIHKRLSESMEELRKNIESFRNSEDFLIIHEELKNWNESFKKELDEMREELMKVGKESRSKGAVFSLM